MPGLELAQQRPEGWGFIPRGGGPETGLGWEVRAESVGFHRPFAFGTVDGRLAMAIQSIRGQAPRVLREANGPHWHQGCQCPL